MLPFTTYNIPESTKRKTPFESKWLWVIRGQAFSATDEELLLKICSALKSDFSSDVLVQEVKADEKISLATFSNSNKELVISFGIPPAQLGIWIDIHQPGIRFLESYTFILTLSLEELSSSPVAKKQLWQAMQQFQRR